MGHFRVILRSVKGTNFTFSKTNWRIRRHCCRFCLSFHYACAESDSPSLDFLSWLRQ